MTPLPQSSFWQFIRSLGHSWASLVSGMLSVPFTVAALLSKDHEQQIWAVLAVTAIIVAAYLTWKNVYEELVDLKTPDISVLFRPDDPRCMPPVTSQLTAHTNILIRQVCIVLENTCGIQIDNVEIYCEEIHVTKPDPHVYLLLPTGSFRAIHLCPKEPFRQGIITEIIETDEQDSSIVSKRIELTLPYKAHQMNLRGSEFMVKVLIVGKSLHDPKRRTYIFGDREGKLFFEEFMTPN